MWLSHSVVWLTTHTKECFVGCENKKTTFKGYIDFFFAMNMKTLYHLNEILHTDLSLSEP
jgi:hypothetical protein